MIRISFSQAFFELLSALPFHVEGHACDLIRKTNGESAPGYSCELYLEAGEEICRRAAILPVDNMDSRREMMPAHVIAWIVFRLKIQPIPSSRHMIACVEYSTGEPWLSRAEVADLIQAEKIAVDMHVMSVERARSKYLAMCEVHGKTSVEAMQAASIYSQEDSLLGKARGRLLEAARRLI